MDYQNYSFRLVDIGLNLRDAPDTVGEGKWVRLNNVDPSQEASISTRPGRNLLYDTGLGTTVHTIKRLGDTTLLLGVGNQVLRDVTSISSGWTGNPLFPAIVSPSIVSSTWAYVSDSNKARKVNAAGTEYKWGISPPTRAASFSATGTGNLNSSAAGAITYDWRYIYYSSVSGAKSNPAPIATAIAVVNQAGSVAVTASTDPQVDQIWLFRRGGVNGGSKWRLSLVVANATATVTDNNADSTVALNEVLVDTNDVPFTSVDANGNEVTEVPLPYVAGPFLGKYILACGDANRPDYIYWTNPGEPDTMDPENNLQVTSPREPLMGVFIYATQPYIWTRDNLYVLDYGGIDALPTFSARKGPCGYGVVGPYAWAVADLIYFVSQNGIYVTDGQTPAQSITEDTLRPIFKGISVSNFAPIDFTQSTSIRLSCVGSELHFVYKDTNGFLQHLIYHRLYKRWEANSSSAMNVTVAYEDENQSRLRCYFGTADGKVYERSSGTTTDNGTAINVNARTGSVDFGTPQTLKEFGNVIVDCDPQGGTVSMTPYLNAETTALPTQTISGTGRQKIPLSLSDNFGYSIAFDWSWTGAAKLYQFDVLYHPDEEVITHWEFPPTTHGMSGWQQIRDAYIVLRSTSTTILTVEVDGVPYTFSVPSTGGLKLKQYVPLSPLKGKVFRYSLDSGSGFRIYGDECEIRVKPWNSKLGYQIVAPFATQRFGRFGYTGVIA